MNYLYGSYVAPTSPDNPGDLAYFRAHTDDILRITALPTNVSALRVRFDQDLGRPVFESYRDSTVPLPLCAPAKTGAAAAAGAGVGASVSEAVNELVQFHTLGGSAVALELGYSAGNTGSATSPYRPEAFVPEPVSLLTPFRPLRSPRAALLKASADAEGLMDAEVELRTRGGVVLRGFAASEAAPAPPAALTPTSSPSTHASASAPAPAPEPAAPPAIFGGEVRWDGSRGSVGVKLSSDSPMWGVGGVYRFYLPQNQKQQQQEQDYSNVYSHDGPSQLPQLPQHEHRASVDVGMEYVISQSGADDSFSIALKSTVPPSASASRAAAVGAAGGSPRRLLPVVSSLVINGVGGISVGVSGPLLQPHPPSSTSSAAAGVGAHWSPHAAVTAAAVGHTSLISRESRLDFGVAVTGTGADAVSAVAAVAPGPLARALGHAKPQGELVGGHPRYTHTYPPLVSQSADKGNGWVQWLFPSAPSSSSSNNPFSSFLYSLRAAITPDRCAALQARVLSPTGRWALQATLGRTWPVDPRVSHTFPPLLGPVESTTGRAQAHAVPALKVVSSGDGKMEVPTTTPVWAGAGAGCGSNGSGVGGQTTLQVAVVIGNVPGF